MEAFKHKEDFKMPEKPSAGIRVAIHDLELCEKNPKYVINMNVWHERLYNDRAKKELCEVCLGGSILARKVDDDYFSHSSADTPLGEKIHAMEYFRRGRIRTGVIEYLETDNYYELGFAMVKEIGKIAMPYMGNWVSYEGDSNKFKKNLLEIADKLEVIGL